MNRDVGFHCGCRVIWDCDYSFEDFCYGEEGEDGIVHTLHCSDCGAEILYYVSLNRPTDSEDDSDA